ncbi:MAG: TraB/GumN family protein [Pantoea sp.]|nr:TraB/GumN family protein [Pantoea sp.]
MERWQHNLTTLLRRLVPKHYRWPATDIWLPGRQLHLVGSIHMGTRNMMPLPPALLTLLEKADALIVEADITGSASPFTYHEPQPPLAQRLDAATLQQLERLCDELHLNLAQLEALPLWQIALMLQAQQAQRLGLRPDYGIDYQLLQAAHAQGRRIIELEGASEQLDILKNLPEDGESLLADTLEHWHTNARLLQTMISWWLERPPLQSRTALPTTFSTELNDLLMRQRNQRWNRLLRELPPGRYVVAVGALHLYGENNLPDLLKRR